MWRIKFLSTPSARRATFAVTAKRRKGNKFLSTPSARRATFWWADVPRICIEFLSTPSARRATEGGEYSRAGEWISIHALREEGDSVYKIRIVKRGYFYPRPPRGGRLIRRASIDPDIAISIHALREEGDLDFYYPVFANLGISIHALREEGDGIVCLEQSRTTYFYPRPPRGGRRGTVWLPACRCGISIHALREEGDARSSRKRRQSRISIHALREEGDDNAPTNTKQGNISIHALREEGDQSRSCHRSRAENFYPRPPRGGRLHDRRHTKEHFDISIHALREEGDPVIFLKEKEISIFLSTPSARRATRMDQPITRAEHISIHALREEGDGCGLATQRSRTISIHALREEGDIWRCRVGRNTENFYPRPPRGGRPEKTTPAILSTRFLSTPSARRATKGRVSAPRDFLFLSTPSARRATVLVIAFRQKP